MYNNWILINSNKQMYIKEVLVLNNDFDKEYNITAIKVRSQFSLNENI